MNSEQNTKRMCVRPLYSKRETEWGGKRLAREAVVLHPPRVRAEAAAERWDGWMDGDHIVTIVSGIII